MQASEGGKLAAKVFSDLDKNRNGVIDGEELRSLSEKVAVALKSRRPPPDGAPEETSGSADVPEGKVGSDLTELMEQAAGNGVRPSQFLAFLSSQSSTKEEDKVGIQLFKRLDVDKSGTLSAEELKGHKSLLYTGRTHADRARQRKWGDHESSHPRKTPPSKGRGEAGGKDLTFAEFEEQYKGRVTNEKQPHGHHKAFLAYVDLRRCSCHCAWPHVAIKLFAARRLDRNEDNFIQPHELNALDRWIRSHPDL